MDHVVDGPAGTESVDSRACPTSPGSTVAADLAAGRAAARGQVPGLRLVAGSARSPAIRDQVGAPRSTAARQTGWDGLLAEQRAYLDDFWDARRRRGRGRPELQQAVRFALFHVLQAGARAERRAIPAKGLTGPGYDGHAFWDTETFVLPVLTYTAPAAAADALRWRHSHLDLARERARAARPAGRGLPVADDPRRGVLGLLAGGHRRLPHQRRHRRRRRSATRARQRRRGVRARASALELLVETARLWRSLGHHDADGRFRIDGVTGPDEYSAIADNNVYTNLMAQRNLRAAAEAAERHPDRPRASASTTRRARSLARRRRRRC